MKHTSSHPAQILMSGRNPEHSHSHKAHGGISHASSMKPAEHLMRQHHWNGGPAGASHYATGGSSHKARRFAKGGHCYAEGGDTEKEYGGEKPLSGQLRRGGRAKCRQHHYEGKPVEGAPVGDNSVRQEQRKGGRSKRQHHYWGQDFFGRLPLIGGIANSIANTVGTLDKDQYGGSEYVANTPGKKVADIASTIGGILPAAFLKKGGKVHRRHKHHAAGGAAKVRRGMMTNSGHMIHHKV